MKHGAALAICLAVAACGAEDVELARPLPVGALDASGAHDGTVNDGGAAGEGGGKPESGIMSDAAFSGETGDAMGAVGEASDGPDDAVLDGASAACDASSTRASCRPLGEACGSSADCCSMHCASGACSPQGTCAGAGTPCAVRADCCSGLCEPVRGTAARACLGPCRPAGAACQRPSDCCSFACNAGTCGGPECLQEGTDCSADAQCCSDKCDASQGNKCTLDPVAVCRPTAENCTSGGGNPCCATCDNTSKRCDPGPGPCRVVGTVCSAATDCCHGSCLDDGTGRTVCTSPLLANGVACQAGFECTSGACVGDPPVCGAAPAACGITGSSCTSATQCCSGVCAQGSCQSGC